MKLGFNCKIPSREITIEELEEQLTAVGVVNMVECYRHYPDKYLRAVAGEEGYMLFHFDEYEKVHKLCLVYLTYEELVSVFIEYAKGWKWKKRFLNCRKV